MAKPVKMADIAAKLNVSTVTVSKALSNQKGVSDEVRDRIKKLALEMGYQKPNGKQEERRQSFNIGVLVPEGYIVKYETFYWEMYQEINMTAVHNNSFVMLEVLSGADEKSMVPPKLLKESKVDGLIVLGGLQSSYLTMIREHYSTPTVYVDFYDPYIKEDSVISNSFYGTYVLTNYLFEKGHENIAFVGTVLATNSITDRYLGYVKSLAEHGKKVREDWVIDDRDRERHNYENVRLPEEMPTALVCNCDMTASRVIRTLREAGYRVPEDVSVVGFDDFLYPGLCDIPLTTYAVNMTGMAESGVKLLLKKMTGRETSKGMHLIEGRFVERESVKAI
ncbi:MAG: LacI family DNA-binding transcriptional regulator [Lachnospiraceae bacterium]